MSLLILLFSVKNLRVEMGYEQIITNGKKQDFEPSWGGKVQMNVAQKWVRNRESSKSGLLDFFSSI